ncbi:hypothetical protein R4769_01140 [Azotobacter beijerinckii]|nr:hypothetical protein [Azotobacter beijerinckii]
MLNAELSLRVPLARLDLESIGQIVLVESPDSFDDWHVYPAPAELADSLVLYRGHGGLARRARGLPAIWIRPGWAAGKSCGRR